MSDERKLAEVALGVPLRQTFTYSVPAELDEVVVRGSRVAVAFHGRKLAGFVLRRATEAPAGVASIKPIAGVLEREPVFDDELLAFLERAADYYFHPIGEVLRAAAPPLAPGALRRLRETGFLDRGEKLPGKRGRATTVVIAERLPQERSGKLSAKQHAILDVLEEGPPLTLPDLRARVPATLAQLRALAERGLLVLHEREVVTDPFLGASVVPETAPSPTSDQAEAIAVLTRALGDDAPGTFLLQGITGSGKTEVYLRVIAETLARGRGAIVLVPEIALTPQLVARFRARLGDGIAVLHSGLRDTERDDAWRALASGRVRLAIGARSALFAPVRELGVVVVDEEHDPSFKQEETFRYHARDMALLRAHKAGALAVLGSATPSVETRHLCEIGRARRLVLAARATGSALPAVEIVDLRRHRAGPTMDPRLSAPLLDAIARCLDDRGQAILFLNRRGFAPSIRCAACGELVACPACAVSLTEHRREGQLRCHYCDLAVPTPERCPKCGGGPMDRLGLGTEKLEETLGTVFPSARIDRLDRDTASDGRAIAEVLDRLRRREIDVLVGTQMVTKGHDLPDVTLVGVILADQSLSFPDFRASERTFQLLAQVAGRAGRASRPGRVIFQAFQPEAPAIQLAAQHDYEAFYRAELLQRQELGWPPFGRLVMIRIDAGAERAAERAGSALAAFAKQHPAVRQGKVRVLGPAAAPLARLRGRYRFQLILRSADRALLRHVTASLAARIHDGLAPARASIDVDPVGML